MSVAATGAQPAADVDVADGKALYARSGCATCHGPAGKGDGPAAAALIPQPQDMSDGPRMSALSDAFLFQIIKEGGTAVERSSTMPPAPKSVTDDEIRRLVVYVRSLAPKSP